SKRPLRPAKHSRNKRQYFAVVWRKRRRPRTHNRRVPGKKRRSRMVSLFRYRCLLDQATRCELTYEQAATSTERGPNASEAHKGYPSHRSGGAAMLEIEAVRMEFPADANIIVGQSHFIKTVEDLYEAVSTTVPQAKFGLAFNES